MSTGVLDVMSKSRMGIEVNEISKARVDWWRGSVIYQVYPRSFCDSKGQGWGDLNGIRSRLGYLAKLGVDILWISPVFKSPMKDFGYDIEDHRAIDSMFGTDADFDDLVADAKRFGLKIMVDLVLSHVSDTHPWFVDAASNVDSEYSDCFVWADPKPDGTPPNNWLSFFGGSSWTWNATRRQYYLHHFLKSQPDLNFHSPKVRQEALSIARYWLDRGVSGFRLDTVNFYVHDALLRDNPPTEPTGEAITQESNPYSYQDHIYDKNRPETVDFLDELGALMAEYPESITLGEIGSVRRRSWPLIHQYTEGQRLDLCYSFDLLGDTLSAPYLRDVIQRQVHDAPHTWPCWALSNHDVARSASRLAPRHVPIEQAARCNAALLLSLRGTPCLYQGEELGLPDVEVAFEDLQDPYGIQFWPDYKGRDGCRTPIPWALSRPQCGFTTSATPWLPIADTHRHRAVDQQNADAQSVLMYVRQLISLRKHENCLRYGDMRLLESPTGVFAFARTTDTTTVHCYFNLTHQPITVDVAASPGTQLLMSGSLEWAPYRLSHSLSLAPWTWAWLRIPATRTQAPDPSCP